MKLFFYFAVIFYALIAFGMTTYGMVIFFRMPTYGPQEVFASIPFILLYLVGIYSIVWVAYRFFKKAKLILGAS